MARQGVGRLTPCWGREEGWPLVSSRDWYLRPHKSYSGKSVIYVKMGHYWFRQGLHFMLQSHGRKREEWRHQLCCVCYCSRDLQWTDTRPPCHWNCKDLLCNDIEIICTSHMLCLFHWSEQCCISVCASNGILALYLMEGAPYMYAEYSVIGKSSRRSSQDNLLERGQALNSNSAKTE